MKKKKQKTRLRNDNILNNPSRKKVSNADDINIKKYKPRGSYRGDSPLDD